MDGERDGGEREGEVWRPRFSSRDVNNDRNDRIRPRPLVFRVTSGRVTADNARLVAWRFPNRGRNPPPPPPPFLSPFQRPFIRLPLLLLLLLLRRVSLDRRRFDDSARYERGGCAYLQRGPDLRRRMTHNRAIEANPVLPFRPCATSHPFSPHPRLVSLARSLARSPPPPSFPRAEENEQTDRENAIGGESVTEN